MEQSAYDALEELMKKGDVETISKFVSEYMCTFCKCTKHEYCWSSPFKDRSLLLRQSIAQNDVFKVFLTLVSSNYCRVFVNEYTKKMDTMIDWLGSHEKQIAECQTFIMCFRPLVSYFHLPLYPTADNSFSKIVKDSEYMADGTIKTIAHIMSFDHNYENILLHFNDVDIKGLNNYILLVLSFIVLTKPITYFSDYISYVNKFCSRIDYEYYRIKMKWLHLREYNTLDVIKQYIASPVKNANHIVSKLFDTAGGLNENDCSEYVELLRSINGNKKPNSIYLQVAELGNIITQKYLELPETVSAREKTTLFWKCCIDYDKTGDGLYELVLNAIPQTLIDSLEVNKHLNSCYMEECLTDDDDPTLLHTLTYYLKDFVKVVKAMKTKTKTT